MIDGGKSSGDDRIEQACQEFITTAYEQMNNFFLNPPNQTFRKHRHQKTAETYSPPIPENPQVRLYYSYHSNNGSSIYRFSKGEYLIDPNGGDSNDAILVKCNAKKRSTCITPDRARSQNVTYYGDEEEVWLSEMEDGMQV